MPPAPGRDPAPPSEDGLLRVLSGLVVALHALRELAHAAGQALLGPALVREPHAIEQRLRIGEGFTGQRVVDREPVLDRRQCPRGAVAELGPARGSDALGTGLLRGLLYGVGPFDVGSYLFAVAVLGGAAAAAAYLPARGVGREDLTTVLRDS
ncbi:MAG: hypothetical protein ABFS46_11905 [Myxococcota bacterium]